MIKSCLYLLISFPIFLGANEGRSPKAERAKTILEIFEPQIEKALEEYQVPGIAVGVVVDGHVVFAKGFGYRNVEARLPVTKETLFAIGSCTKAFTTFAVGNLVDEGLIHWDQPVIDVLPEFRLWDQYATTNLTIRDLLTHRSGLPRHEFAWYNSKMSKAEMLKRIRYLQPSFDIRERYQYGNLMYFITGLAMERASEKNWEDLVRERILIPLEMHHTNFSIDQTQKGENFAYPYLEKHDRLRRIAFRNLSLISPAGGINSNIEDMTHWIQMLLKGGGYKDQILISPTTLQELHAPQVIIPGLPETKESLLYAYAMGWGVLSYRGYYFVSHDGVSDGFTSVAGIFPSENIGIVVLANKNMSSLPRYLSLEIIDRLLGLPCIEWLKEGVENIRKNKQSAGENLVQENRHRKKGTRPSHPLEDYVGLYEHPGYGSLAIELVDDHLQANFNDLIFVLGHWHYDVFSVIEEKQDMIVCFEGTKFTFCNNANGDIAELKVPFEPTADEILFQKRAEEKLSMLTYLKRFTGVYEIYGYTVEVVMKENALVAVIPGQPNYELMPMGENEFSVKGMVSSMVRFVLDKESRVQEVLLIHPYGSFSAVPKK